MGDMMEVWRSIVGFDQYEISDQGNVRHKNPRKGDPAILKGARDKDGYIKVYLCVLNLDGSSKRRANLRVHRLVWETFVGPIPDEMQINHKNGIKFDNRLENIEICTPSENTLHGFRVLGRKPNLIPSVGSKNGRSKLSEADIPAIRRMLNEGRHRDEIALHFNVSPAAIWFIQKGKTWTNVPLV